MADCTKKHAEAEEVYAKAKADCYSDMTCEMVLQCLYGHDFEDEMRTSNKYLDYAVALSKEGKDCMAKKVYEMAYEEWTHAKFQKHLLLDEGYDLTDDQLMEYDRLKDRVKRLFCRW